MDSCSATPVSAQEISDTSLSTATAAFAPVVRAAASRQWSTWPLCRSEAAVARSERSLPAREKEIRHRYRLFPRLDGGWDLDWRPCRRSSRPIQSQSAEEFPRLESFCSSPCAPATIPTLARSSAITLELSARRSRDGRD